jgi:hypothetical protein
MAHADIVADVAVLAATSDTSVLELYTPKKPTLYARGSGGIQINYTDDAGGSRTLPFGTNGLNGSGINVTVFHTSSEVTYNITGTSGVGPVDVFIVLEIMS